MTIRIPTIAEWWPLEEPLQMVLREHEEHRFVRLYVNTTDKTAFHYWWNETDAEGKRFRRGCLLASVDGFEKLEFTIHADGELTATSKDADDGQVWVRTDDGVQYHLAPPIADGYAEPYVRKQRNPDQERMLFQANLNMRRREQRLAATIERFEEARAIADADREAAVAAKGKRPRKPVAGADPATAGGTGEGDSSNQEGAAKPSKPQGQPNGEPENPGGKA